MASRLPVIATAIVALALGPTRDEPVVAQSASMLDQRPLKLPVVRSGERCPTTAGSRDTVPRRAEVFAGSCWFGRDPVSVALAWKDSLDDQATFSLAPVPRDGDARRAKTMWASEPAYSGPILIRGHALDSEERALEFRAAGEGRGRNLHLLAPNGRTETLWWSFWPSSMWVPGPGCYGVQLDTLSGTAIVVFQAT
jgi:hypothetical protein